MDLSLGIVDGLQCADCALCHAGAGCLASYIFGQPMNLEFTLPEIAAVLLSVWIVSEISGDGECNWAEGVQLLSVYLIIAILFYFLPEAPHVQQQH